MNKRRLAFLMFSSLLLLPATALAEDFYWVGASGAWEDPSNWSLTEGGPGGADPSLYSEVAYKIISTDSIDRTIYLSSNVTILTRSDLYVNSTGTGMITFNINTGASIYNYAGSIPAYSTPTFDRAIVNSSGGMGYIGSFGVNNVYNLNTGGSISGMANDVTVRGTFNQNGGNVSCDVIKVDGIYNLNSGTLYSWAPYIEAEEFSNIKGVFNQNGGTFSSLYSPVKIDSTGSYNLNGGVAKIANLVNSNVINYSGGDLILQEYGGAGDPAPTVGSFTNAGIVNLFGTGTRTITGDIVNNGTFKTTNTIAYYNGTFTNNGAYISDPATQTFNDLIIGQNGYLIGQSADVFKVSGDLISRSIMNADWNTLQSYLQFISGTDSIHDFYLTGANYGARMPGYANNFAWGVLDVSGNIVNFYDGNSEAGAALYLREILGLDIDITDMLIANLFGFDGLDIYYMPNLRDNWYLHGRTYDLAGGGHLRPVPEPPTMLLLGSGLAALARYGRKRLNKQASNRWNR